MRSKSKVALAVELSIKLENVHFSSEFELQNPILIILAGILRNVT